MPWLVRSNCMRVVCGHLIVSLSRFKAINLITKDVQGFFPQIEQLEGFKRQT